MMIREVFYGEGGEAGTPILYPGVQARSSPVGPYWYSEGSCVTRPRDSSERSEGWLRQFDQDPDNPFPGKGKMKPEEAELFRLKRELMKVTAERDTKKKHSRASQKTISEVRLHGTLP